MPETKPVFDGNLDLVQAAELAAVVELEARWENLRTGAPKPTPAAPTIQDLHGKQKAYEAFRLKLAAYNKRYARRISRNCCSTHPDVWLPGAGPFVNSICKSRTTRKGTIRRTSWKKVTAAPIS